MGAARVARGWFERDPVELAPLLLGATLAREGDDGRIAVRITETEAYRGTDDPGAHSFRGKTARNQTMFGEAGHLYCYFTYGLHHALNCVAGNPGEGWGVLLRAGEVTTGEHLVRARRDRAERPHPHHHLARGPGNLASAFGATLDDDGADLLAAPWSIDPAPESRASTPLPHATGPRVGVSGPGGDATAFPWRFWLPGEPSVSAYRRGGPGRTDPGSTDPGRTRPQRAT